jgi:hypothetical protein
MTFNSDSGHPAKRLILRLIKHRRLRGEIGNVNTAKHVTPIQAHYVQAGIPWPLAHPHVLKHLTAWGIGE